MSKKIKLVNPDVVKKPEVKISPEEEKLKLYSNIQNFVNKQGTDENLDNKNEKFNIVEYKRHNSKSHSLLGKPKEWKIRFTDKFYDPLRRILRMPVINGKSHIRPFIFAKITNDIIYLRFPEGTLRELQERNPIMPDGNRLVKHHQLLNDIADAHLKQFLQDVEDVIDGCDYYDQFYQRLRKKLGKSWQMSFYDIGLLN